MEPVDFYLSAFTALGAQAQWWPLDAALARALENGDCQALSDHRLAVLGLHARETVYPDLHALQQQACAQPDELLAQLRAAQGVFFAGGDQWRLRQAFFGADDRPLPWLRALRAAHERGTLVAGGTSAGAAVQSGANGAGVIELWSEDRGREKRHKFTQGAAPVSAPVADKPRKK
jgi:hypothetical protein